MAKRSVSISGHRTSLSLEEPFWQQLQVIAQRDGLSVAALIAQVDAGRDSDVNLSSALRVFVLHDALGQRLTHEQDDAPSLDDK